MRNITYIVGAGLTKALEQSQRIPVMQDYVYVLAEHIDDPAILTHFAVMEAQNVFESRSAEGSALARDLGRGVRSPEAVQRYKAILQTRPAENIEKLLQRSFDVGGSDECLTRFSFAINRFFSRVGWNLNLDILRLFLERQFRIENARHTFISFNYELTLDRCIQDTAATRWNPRTGYGIPVRYVITALAGTDHMKQFEGDGGAFGILEAKELPESPDDSRIHILKPHGSLNFIVPFDGNYNFVDGEIITILNEAGEIDYYPTFDLQNASLPSAMPKSNRGLFIIPPSFAKTSSLEIIRTIREKEYEALRTADEVFVIGWSMPETDQDQLDFIRSAVKERKSPLDRLTAVSYKSPPDYFARLSDVFGVDADRVAIFNDGFVRYVNPRRRFTKLAKAGAGLLVLLTLWALYNRIMIDH